MDDTQVYITGVLYQQDAYPSDPSVFFNLIDSTLRQITDLGYWELLINRAECRFSNSTTREQLMFFMKDVTYQGSTFLSDSQSSSLRTAIINVFKTVSDITYTDVEIRTTRAI